MLSNFPENLSKNLENFRNMHLQGVLGAEPSEAREFIKDSRKINGNQQFLIGLMEIWPIFKSILKFYRILRENLEIWISNGLQFVKNLVEKSMETCNF